VDQFADRHRHQPQEGARAGRRQGGSRGGRPDAPCHLLWYMVPPTSALLPGPCHALTWPTTLHSHLRAQRGLAAPLNPPSTASLQAEAPPARTLLATWSVPGDAGRRFGALTGDRNPIHLYSFTSQLFGFKRPIAHALYLVARLEAALVKAGESDGKIGARSRAHDDSVDLRGGQATSTALWARRLGCGPPM
jgi:hypothetical protein